MPEDEALPALFPALGSPVPAPDRASAVPVWRPIEDDLRTRLASGDFVTSFPGFWLTNELSSRPSSGLTGDATPALSLAPGIR